MHAQQVIDLNITHARQLLAAARRQLAELTDGAVFTPEYAEAATAAVRAQTLPAVQRELTNARAAATQAERTARDARTRLLAVDDTAMAARAAVLMPLLHAAASRPAILLTAYRNRFENLLDRRILEEAIDAALDAVPPTERLTLQEDFRRAQRDTAGRKSPAEQQADAAVDAAQALTPYAEQWATVLLAETKAALGLPVSSLDAVASANAQAAVAHFAQTAAAQ